MRVFSNVLLALLATASTYASILFQSGTIIAYSHETNNIDVIRNGSVLVEQDRITHIYTGATPPDVVIPKDTEIVSISGKILSPGFVDCHHHLWQTLFKTIESNDTLATYFTLFGETGPAEKRFTHEDSYLSQLAGVLESLNAGVTTIVDHAHGLWSNGTADAILRANIESGARVYFGYAMHHLKNGWTFQDQINKFSAMVSEGLYINTTTSLGIAYDFFSSDPKDEVTQVIELAKRSSVPFITSHYVGGTFLIDNSPEVLNSYGILNTSIPIILSHGTYITERGRQLLRDTDQYMATTPESELQLLFETHHRSALIQDQAALGVDTNFGFSADLLTQARMWLQRLRGFNAAPVKAKGLFPATSPMSVNQAFLLATQHGGLALHRPDIGVIAPGAKADLVVFSTSSPSFLGWNDPVAAVLLHAGIGDIEHVLVDGKFVKRDGKLTYPKYYTKVVERSSQAAGRIQQIWTEIPQKSFEGKKFEHQTPYADVPKIDTQRGPGTGYGVLQVAD